MKKFRKIMSIGLLLVLLSMALAGCESNESDLSENEEDEIIEESENDNKDENEVEEPEKESSEEPEESEEEIIGPDRTIVYEDENGNESFSIKINSVTIADEFIKKEDKTFSAEPDEGVFDSDYEQAVELNYTYSNIGMEEPLEISSFDLDVVDSEGEVSEKVGVLKKSSEEIISDTKFTADAHYALVNKSDKVRVIFFSDLVDKPTIFEVPVLDEP